MQRYHKNNLFAVSKTVVATDGDRNKFQTNGTTLFWFALHLFKDLDDHGEWLNLQGKVLQDKISRRLARFLFKFTDKQKRL